MIIIVVLEKILGCIGYGKMNEQKLETACENCRIAVTTDGIEIDASTGDLTAEVLVLTFIVFVIAAVYVAKKLVDRYIK